MIFSYVVDASLFVQQFAIRFKQVFIELRLL